MAGPVVFGASYSVYVRAVRMALAEKGVPYRLEPVDIFAAGGPPAEHLSRHPFGKIPAFAHDGLTLYEACAIERYIDEAFDGPALQPADAAARARTVQITSILDSYAYRCWVWDIYVPRRERDPSDEARIAAALPRAETALDAIAAIAAPEGRFFLGDRPGLADLHAAPMVDLLRRAPEGNALFEARPRWLAWWRAVEGLESFRTTGDG